MKTDKLSGSFEFRDVFGYVVMLIEIKIFLLIASIILCEADKSFEVNKPSDYYSSIWAIQVLGGPESAKLLAKRYYFDYISELRSSSSDVHAIILTGILHSFYSLSLKIITHHCVYCLNEAICSFSLLVNALKQELFDS
ncbi:hypothetical protein Ciccas_001361 [Cichlidogyrus casuarinus]|uniref:Uncharacterized protein n=1 Tax=Cichlidogyrus casuarinus TaxID=1844966 RepID=A0ABD2QLE7_9PLAT